MSVTVSPMPEMRGHYWSGKCFRPRGGCGAAFFGPHCRIRQHRHWDELPRLCSCYPHISRVEKAIVANGDRAWLVDHKVALAAVGRVPARPADASRTGAP